MLDQSPAGRPPRLGAEDPAQAMLGCLVQAGYGRIEPPILQEAAQFLDLGGEEIRAGLYLTSDRSGAELCLRPEYTIPVCRVYLSSAAAGQPAAFSYSGPIFRSGPRGPGEIVQAGLESYGRADTAAADAEILGLALEAVQAADGPPLTIRFADAGLLGATLDALRLPANWQRRLKRGLHKSEPVETILAAAPSAGGDHSGVLAALAGADENGARALVDDLLAIAGITSVGGRSAEEIAERFLAQVALRSAPPFGAEQRAVLNQFLVVSGDPDEAGTALRSLAREAGLDLGQELDLFEERTSFMAAQGIDLGTVTFQASFGRSLDYYTGFVFEGRGEGGHGPMIGGGRYDRLSQALGSPVPIPAVGAALWPSRLHGSMAVPS